MFVRCVMHSESWTEFNDMIIRTINDDDGGRWQQFDVLFQIVLLILNGKFQMFGLNVVALLDILVLQFYYPNLFEKITANDCTWSKQCEQKNANNV